MSNFKNKLFVLFISSALFATQISGHFGRVCYLRVERSQRIDTETIDANLCTHIILGFAVIVNGAVAPQETDDLIYYRNVTRLKKNSPDLKVMLSVGGGGEDTTGLHLVASNQTTIEKFVFSVIDLLLEYDIDGLDIDWEFPAWNTPFSEDKYRFTQLLKSLKMHFLRQENRIERRRRLLLSCAVSAIVNVVDAAYDMPEMAKYVDFVNVMTYDFHLFSKYWPFTGFNAPLFNRKVEKSYFTYLNTNRSVNYWMSLGLTKDKIMVGVPTYGHVFRLASPDYTGPDSAAVAQLSDISYSEVCRLMRNSSTHILFDNEAKVPYLVNGDLWVSYDDPESVALKAQWVRDNQLAGVMTFDLNSDDYTHECDNSSEFVLHSVIRKILQ